MSSAKPGVAIIGSGIAGIASAIRLAVQGFAVTVFEKNNYPGGKLTSLSKDGFHFDAGPSLFIQPSNIEELFQLANEPLEPYFKYKPLPVACKYFYEDGTIINAYADKIKFGQELQQKTGEQPVAIKTYLEASEKIYRHIGSIFLNYSLHRFDSIKKANILNALTHIRAKYLFQTLDQVNAGSFSNAHTVQLFNRYATYSGSNPYKAPGMLSLIPHLEYNEGVFYPEGGMISITNALYQLALKKGVKFYFNTAVDSIIYDKGKVKAVKTAKRETEAGIIISNMDVYYTYKKLLGDDKTASKLLKQERSSSALIFYWGINREFSNLDLHNIFFSSNYKEEFEYLFTLKKIYADPTIYINITAKCEAGIHAPPGKENWFVMINVPANDGQDWNVLKQQARALIISKLNRMLQTDLGDFIEVEESLDPVSIDDKTSSYMGALYGTSSNSKNAAFLRHPNFSRTIKGLYFAGGSVHPGGGIPLCLKSAKIVSEIIETDQKKWKAHQ